LSGLASLIYEITWSRILSTILGNTSLAISIIVSLFMTGLAIGSFAAGRFSFFQHRPLRIYGILEGFIGLYSILTPRMAPWIEQIYAAAYSSFSASFFISILLKALFAALFLLLPSIAMGATLPVLIRSFPSEEQQSRAGLLYGLNTAGAVAGTILAGYFLLPNFGISKTIFLAAGLNALICVLAIALSREEEHKLPSVAHARSFHLLYLLPFFTGFAMLSYEILWIRALSMFFGSSVYAFSAILAAFLLGIAAGSSYYSGRFSSDTDSYQFFSLIQFRMALSAIFFIGVFMGIPYLLIWLFETLYFSFPLFQIGQFILIGCTVFYTTFLAGAAFPASLQFFRADQERLQAHVAYVYSYNTIGSILGSLCAGFLLIPLLGVERSIRVIILLNLILGIFCFRKSSPAKQDKRVLLIGAASLAFLIFLPMWNRSIYNSGFYAFAYKYVPKNKVGRSSIVSAQTNVLHASAFSLPSARAASELNLLYYGEGLTATVAVVEHEAGIRSLLINGKPEASNVPTGDMRTQLLLGHLPVLLKGDVKDALVIGLGSGVTAGALWTHHPNRIDCVEIEKKVAEAARYYEAENLGILNRPNFRLILDDGRNMVQHTANSYDVITSEPSNLWMSGVANLFTREFFLAARKKLRPDGVMCQWIHLYQISWHDVTIFLKTFQSVFPYLSIWVDGSDMLVMGSAQRMPVLVSKIEAEMLEPDVLKSMERSNLSTANLLKKYLSNERIVKILRVDIPLNTDDHPILEFSAPKSMFFNHSEEIVRGLYELRLIADQNP
jgi:spermidine synthase